MGFTSSWCTQHLGNLKRVDIVWVDAARLGDLNGVYVVLVDAAAWVRKWGYIVLVDAGSWGLKWSLHRLGGHSCLGI
jgi:hypothetical protein